jgi:hypothetical protein
LLTQKKIKVNVTEVARVLVFEMSDTGHSATSKWEVSYFRSGRDISQSDGTKSNDAIEVYKHTILIILGLD